MLRDLVFPVSLSFLNLSFLFLRQLNLINGLAVSGSDTKSKLPLFLNFADTWLVVFAQCGTILLRMISRFTDKGGLCLEHVLAVLLKLEIAVSHLCKQLFDLSHGVHSNNLLFLTRQKLFSLNLDFVLLFRSVRIVRHSCSVGKGVMHA